jgi:hypothetical protein
MTMEQDGWISQGNVKSGGEGEEEPTEIKKK